MSGIYIHVPFCKQACNYCDFYFSTSLLNKAQYVEAVLKEIEKRHSYLSSKVLDSVYLGGGTPSLLETSEIERILKQVKVYFTLSPSAEFTLEANPDDITEVKLSGWRKLGINRLSIGLQSFENDELKWMNRAHTAEESVNSVILAQEAGFDNISIDLIYGSKFQTLTTWANTLKRAIQLNVQHISSYNLTIEGKTLLSTKNAKGLEPPVNETLSGEMFQLMQNMLLAEGFIQYEVSNFAKENYFAVHNSSYWKQEEYLGLGPSAHSYNVNSRQWNVKNNNQYIKQINQNLSYFEVETLSVENRYNEYVLTRLRTIWGCSLSEIEVKFGKKFSDHFYQKVLRHAPYLEEINGCYILNTKGLLLADGIASDLFVL